jgi:hypothetical protein
MGLEDTRLRANEAEIARLLIRARSGPDEADLLAQVDNAVVVSREGTWVELAVDSSGPIPDRLDGPLPRRRGRRRRAGHDAHHAMDDGRSALGNGASLVHR